jgi:hypothetical protein
MFDIRQSGRPTAGLRHRPPRRSGRNAVQVLDPVTGAVSLDIRTLAGVTNAIRHDGDIVATQIAFGNVWAVNDTGAAVLASGLAFPEGIAVDGDRLLVVETGLQQVTAIDLATGDMSPVIVGLDYSDRIPEGFFPFGIMSGVAVGERSICVSDDGVNKVCEFRRRR